MFLLMQVQLSKKASERYYTEGDPFGLASFQAWPREGLVRLLLEPFAGANHLIHALQRRDYASVFTSYDLLPPHPSVTLRDTLQDFPQGF